MDQTGMDPKKTHRERQRKAPSYPMSARNQDISSQNVQILIYQPIRRSTSNQRTRKY